MQSNVNQGNFMPIDNCSHCKDFGLVTSMCPKEKLLFTSMCAKEKLFTLVEIGEDKFIEEQIPKFDDEELVDSKYVFTCEDKCIILEEHKLKDEIISLPCLM